MCLSLLGDMDAWHLIKQSEDIATFTRTNSTEFMVRAEMLLHHPVFPVLALFSECQLLHEWVPILENARVLGTPSKFRRVIQYFMKLPWPVENRDMMVSAIGIPIPQNKSVLIVLKSIETPSYLEVEVPPPSNVRIDLKLGCLNVTYVSANETQISMITRCDPKLALVPAAIINYATKHGVFYFMEAIKKMCDEYSGSQHEELVNANPGYYQEIRDRINLAV